MGFKQRERKRRRKIAVAGAQRESRRTGSSTRKWWLTVVSRHTCCARCSGGLRAGRPMIYRRSPQESLCLSCAEGDPTVKYRPSTRWEEQRSSSRKKRSSRAA
jgi:hypothetical protein